MNVQLHRMHTQQRSWPQESTSFGRDDEARTATMKSVGSGYTGVTGVVNGGSIYKVATKNSTGTMSTRLDPVKDYRHGLAAKYSAAAQHRYI